MSFKPCEELRRNWGWKVIFRNRDYKNPAIFITGFLCCYFFFFVPDFFAGFDAFFVFSGAAFFAVLFPFVDAVLDLPLADAFTFIVAGCLPVPLCPFADAFFAPFE